MKNNFFSFSRFVNFCRKDMVESWRANILRIVLMYGIMTIILIFRGYFVYTQNFLNSSFDPMVPFSQHIFIIFIWVFGLLSASFMMEKIKNKTNRISVLMTPASSTEKFMSRWVISTIAFLVVYLIVFILADYTRVLIYSFYYAETVVATPVKLIFSAGSEPYHIFKNPKDVKLMIMGYFLVQSFFVLGSTVWPKNSFIKTFTAGFLILFSYGLIGAVLLKLFIDETKHYNSNIGPDISQEKIILIISITMACITLFNWIMAYFRFKETEIINRM